ncbi:hypothetical protein ACVIGB_000766 [Bradyrhizobium sp. USDA 4341]
MAAVAALPIPALARGSDLSPSHGGRALWRPEAADHAQASVVSRYIDRILATGKIGLSHSDAYYLPMYLEARAPTFMIGLGDVTDTKTAKTESGTGLSVAIFDRLKIVAPGLYHRTESAENGFAVRWPHVDDEFLKLHADRVRVDHEQIIAWLDAARNFHNPMI